MLAVYHCDHITRERGSWSLCWLSSIVITSLGKEGVGRCAGRLLVCPPCVVSRFTILPLGGLRSYIVTLPGELFIVFMLEIKRRERVLYNR